MSRLRVLCFGLSLDGYGAGPDQSLQHPLGVHGPDIMSWFTPTRTWRQMQGQEEGETGVDDDMARQGMEGIGAWILGRNMFGPIRGPWRDESWKGWWGPEPPYHTKVFVLTHHRRPPLEMEGGTTFHFLDASPAEALATVREAANGQDVRIGGGPTTIREFLAAGLIDQLHVVVVPILLGRGVRLWDGLEGLEQEFETEVIASPSGVAHVTFTRRGA